jgi:hypothetical protein
VWRRNHGPIDRPLRKPRHGLCESAHLQDRDIFNIVSFQKGAKRKVGNRSKSSDPDFFPSQTAKLRNLRANHQGLGEIRYRRRDLDDVASPQDVRNDRWSAKARDIADPESMD